MAGVPAPRPNGTRARDPARGPPARRTGSAFDMGAIGGVVRTVLSVDDFALFRRPPAVAAGSGLSGHAVIW